MSELVFRQRRAVKLGWTEESGFPKEGDCSSCVPALWYVSASQDDFGSHRTDLPESPLHMCPSCAEKGLHDVTAPYAYQKYQGAGRCELCGITAGNPDVTYSNAPYEHHTSYGKRYGNALSRQ